MSKSKLSTLLAATLMAGGLIMGTPAYATPLTPFTVTDSLGFDVSTAVPTGGSFANVTTTELEWRLGASPTSFLRIISPPSNTPVVIQSDTPGWVDIAQLQHVNNPIPGDAFSFNISMIDSLTIPGVLFAANNSNTIATTLGIAFLETSNDPPGGVCPGLNPLSSTCDDTFTITGLNGVLGSFLFNNGTEDFSITFRIRPGLATGSYFDGVNTIYTAENFTSNLFIQAQINQVPEPGSLALLGIGLVGLLPIARRAKKADAKKA